MPTRIMFEPDSVRFQCDRGEEGSRRHGGVQLHRLQPLRHLRGFAHPVAAVLHLPILLEQRILCGNGGVERSHLQRRDSVRDDGAPGPDHSPVRMANEQVLRDHHDLILYPLLCLQCSIGAPESLLSPQNCRTPILLNV